MGPTDIITTLGLTPLPVEGGLYGQMLLSEHATAIYYLLSAPEFSALHKLTHVEVFAYHAGAPARMLLLHPDGRVERPVLGMDLAAGQRPQVVVPAGTWQATETLGEWSLLGTFMAPPYTDDCVTFADESVATRFPELAEEVRRLSPSGVRPGGPAS
ncbi:cupin domain-containing protein [Kibdelosporangium lantanae]